MRNLRPPDGDLQTVLPRVSRGASLLGMIMLLELLGPRQAHAYLDPMTGSIVLQALVGGLLAGLYFVRRHMQGLKQRLRRHDKMPTTTDGEK